MLNQTILVGRIAKEVEIKELDEGKKVSYLTLAVQRSYKNEEGEYETDFVPVTLWNGIAANVAEYCRQGDLIGVKGRIQSDNNGLVIVADKVTFLSSKNPKDEE